MAKKLFYVFHEVYLKIYAILTHYNPFPQKSYIKTNYKYTKQKSYIKTNYEYTKSPTCTCESHINYELTPTLVNVEEFEELNSILPNNAIPTRYNRVQYNEAEYYKNKNGQKKKKNPMELVSGDTYSLYPNIDFDIKIEQGKIDSTGQLDRSMTNSISVLNYIKTPKNFNIQATALNMNLNCEISYYNEKLSYLSTSLAAETNTAPQTFCFMRLSFYLNDNDTLTPEDLTNINIIVE